MRLSVLMLAAVCTPGCPGTGAGDGGLPADAGDEFCSRYGEAFCARELRCGRELMVTRSRCEERVTFACVMTGARFVASGAALYDPDAGRSCLDGLATRSDCGEYQCTPFTLGGGVGQACAWNSYCREGYCRGGGPGTCAACAPFVAFGQPCSERDRCNEVEAFCDPATSRCAARKPPGAACSMPGTQLECVGFDQCAPLDGGARCGPLREGEPCGAGLDCGAVSFCEKNPMTGTDGICRPRKAAGASCLSTLNIGECREGLACLDGACVSAAGGRDAGEACSPLAACLSGLVCNADPSVPNRSVCRRPGQQGERCEPSSATCAEGFACTCRQQPCTVFTCERPGDVGAQCPCLGGLLCRLSTDGGVSQCTLPPRLGEPCGALGECPPFQVCRAGSCALPGAAGAPCREPSDCDSYACQPDGGCAAKCF